MREKRRAGARPAALAVAVIAALLVPAGTAAADAGEPAEESGVVAEPAPVPAEPVAETAPAEAAPVGATTVPEAPVEATTVPVTASDDDSVVIIDPETTPDPTPVEVVPADSSEDPQAGQDEAGDLSGDVTFAGLTGEWYRPMATVGSIITAVEDGFPAGTTVVYAWTVAGETRGTAATYLPSEADLGQQIHVSWTASAPGWNSLSGGQRVAWDTLPADEAPLATMRGQIVVSGNAGAYGDKVAYVDRTLTVAPDGEWPTDAQYAWSWDVDGVTRSHSTSYTPSEADLGKQIWVYVTVTAPGYQSVSTGVHAAASVAVAPVVPQGGVTIAGRSDNEDIALGTTLKVQLDDAWPAVKQTTIQWTVNGEERGTGSSFTPQAADLGAYVQVRVTVTAQDMPTFNQNFWLGTVRTTPKVTIGSSTVAAGRSAEIPVTVAGPKGGPVPTGTVDLVLTPRAGGAAVPLPGLTLDAGSAVATVPGLAIGTYDVTASYSGQQIIYSRTVSAMASSTAAYLKATGTGTVTVAKATVQLTAPGTLSVPVATRGGFEASVAAPGSPLPEAWTVREGDTVLAQGEVPKGGRFAVTLPVLGAGTHTLVLSVPATEWTAAASRTITVTVAGEPSQVGTTPTTGTVLETPQAATVPGQQMELVAVGFQPGETVAFYLHSEPVYLGTAVADAFGVARLMATVPADVPAGAHTVIATGGTSGRWATLAVQLALPGSAAVPVSAPVAAAPVAVAAPGALAVTGSQSGVLGLTAGLLLAAGGGLVLVGRRVRATR